MPTELFPCICEHECFVWVCVCVRREIPAGWGVSGRRGRYKVWLRSISDHFKAGTIISVPVWLPAPAALLSEGSLFWQVPYCPRLCWSFHEHTENTTPKYAGGKEEQEEEGRAGVVLVAWVKVKNTQKLFFRENTHLNTNSLDVWWLQRRDVVTGTTRKKQTAAGHVAGLYTLLKALTSPFVCKTPYIFLHNFMVKSFMVCSK